MSTWRLVSLLAFFVSFSSRVFAVDVPVLSGSIQRGSNVSSFALTVKINSVSKFGLLSGETDLFKNRIRVYINGKSDAVPFQGDPPLAAMPFTLSQSADLQIVNNASDANLRDFTYTLLVAANSHTDFKAFLDENGGKSLKLTVKYLEANAEVQKKENEVISVSAAIISSAPESVSASGTHREIKIKWNSSTTVTWTGATPSTKPSDITLVAIEKASTLTDLPAYIFNESADNDSEAADGTCTFSNDYTDGSACVTCSNAKAYLNTEELSKLSSSGVYVAASSPDTGEASISGLENGKAYAIFAYYSPGGLSRSVCQTSSPVDNTTYSELNGEDEASRSDPKCFIATAAYGSPLHKNLKPLRWFRDQVLLKFDFGKNFVRWYYENGPKAATYVTASPILQLLARGMLWIPVIALSAWMAVVNDLPGGSEHLILACAIAAAAIVSLGILRKTRGAK